MEYKDIFSPKTLEKLNKKSAENLKTMLGDKNLMQTMMSSQQILSQIARAEAPYKSELEQLAIQMVKELYPIIDEEGIVLDAKLVGMSDVGRELDEITVNKPNHYFTISMIPLDPEDEDDEEYISYPTGEIIFPSYLKGLEFSQIGDSFYQTHFNDITKHQDLYSDLINYLKSKNIPYKELTAGNFRHINIDSKYFKQPSKLNEALTPESRRRIINAITQGAALRGAFAFYLFKEHLDELDSSLVEKYNQIMKNSFGIYDDENAIAMMLAALAQGQKMAGGSSKVIMKEIIVRSPSSLKIIKIGDNNWGLVVNGKYLFADTYHHPSRPEIDKYKTVYAQIDVEEDNNGDEYLYVYIPEPSFGGGGDPDEINDAYDEFEEDLAIAEEVLTPYIFRKRGDSYDIKLDRISNIDLIPTINENKINEADSGITIRARAICFPMLVHELIKGLYELVSLQGFKGDKAANQAVVDKVDLLKNEPSDIRYGKFIFDALNNIFSFSEYSDDPRVREFFFTEVYKLEDDEFIEFIENAINEELTSSQQKWVKDTLRDIAIDLKSDDFSATGLDEIRVNTPGLLSNVESYKSQIKFADSIELQKELFLKIADLFLPLYKKSYSSDDKAVKAIEAARNYLANPTEDNKSKVMSYGAETARDAYNNPTSLAGFVGMIISMAINFTFYRDEKILDRDINEFFRFIDGAIKKSQKMNEIKINRPKFKISPDKLPPLDLTIGNFDISKGRVGTEVHFDSKLIHSATRKRVLQVFDKLGIKPEKAWIAWIKRDDGSIASLKSTFVLSHYKGEPILIAQTQTNHPQAGQMYIYSKYVKSGKSLRLPQPGVSKDDSVLFADYRNTTKEQILNALQIPDGEPAPLNEYSDKVINATLERWKDEKGFDQNASKQLIQRFDQIKSSLSQRLDIVVLPDELKKSNKFLDINQYSFEDMVKLIASIPENPEKAKKEAIKKFTEKEGIDRNTAQSYVARFMTKRDDLKFAGKEGSDISKEDLDQFVPKRLMINNAYLDPRNWTWEPFEQMMDALFPSAGKSVEGEENTASTDADKVYDKNGIEIYKGDDVHKCISYNPVEADQRKKYGWCVTQVGNTNYDYYRFGEKSPTFYFVFDRSKSSLGPRGNFDDQWHAFVVQVNADGQSYTITGADNRGDIKANSWEGISKIVPSGTWNKIKDLKDYFKPIALSGVERGRKFASGKNLTLDEFKELTQDEKILYIQGKASKNQISSDILAILPKYKINLEGRSTTLANVAIDSGQKIPYSSLKDNEQLAKRYAIFRFRHTNYSKDPIPLPYVKYLDEEAKKKYAQTFDEYLTYEYLDKFFGEKVTEEYVNKQVKNLSFLPKEADKYIKDPKLKQLFDTYSKLFDSWEYDAKTNVSDEQLENFSDMPEQQIDPRPMIYSQWAGLSNSERKTIITLAERYDQNQDYAILLWGLPFIIKDGSKTYALLPLDKDKSTLYYKWVLSDENGKIVKNLSGKSTLNGNSIEGGYADVESSYQRVYGMNDLKIDSSEVKENISKDLTKFFTLKKSW